MQCPWGIRLEKSPKSGPRVVFRKLTNVRAPILVFRDPASFRVILFHRFLLLLYVICPKKENERERREGEKERDRERERERECERERERERERFLICHVSMSYVDMYRERAKV